MSNTGILSKGFKALMVSQFMGALNDNAFKFFISAIIIEKFDQSQGGTFYLALCGVVFILPFLLFSTFAGYLADRFSKKNIIVLVKAVELIVMGIGFWALLNGNIGPILTVLFFMGLHSALFSPSKYGILPEILEENKLSNGNGIIQMWTYVAILIGQASSGFMMQWTKPHYHHAAYIFIGISVIGLIASFYVTKVPVADKTRKFEVNFFKELIENLRWIKQDKAIFLAMIGLMYFGFLAGLFQPNVLLYARKVMGVDYVRTGFLIAAFTMGIGLGCRLAGKMSSDKVELGLVPLGSIGLSCFAIMMGFVHSSYPATIITIFLLGISSGFYMLPLNALIQTNSPKDRLGKTLATNSFLSFSGILVGSLFIYILRDLVHLDAAQIFMLIGLLTISGTIYTIRILPYAFVRFIIWLLAHTVYKIKTFYPHYVPERGGALLVCNHVSYIDAVLLVVTLQRPIRFLMYRNIYNIKMLKPIFKLAGAIPISYTDGPKEILKALNEATAALKNGELVCIFPEGQLTRTGNMLRFNRGLERIVADTDCPIVPVHLDRVWGSIFSYERGKYFFKWPKMLPYPVSVTYGEPMPAKTSAFVIRNKIRELGAHAFIHRFDERLTLPENFWREARRNPRKFCIADGLGKELTFGETLISSIILGDKLKGLISEQENIGILLPPSVGGVLANIAVSFQNKIPVNLNYTASSETIDSIIHQCQMKTVLTSRLFMDKLNLKINCNTVYIEDLIKNVKLKEKVIAVIKGFMMPGRLSYRILFGRRCEKSIDQLATIMFTSGSTGEPKGVMLSHANITSNLEGLYQIFHIQKDDILMGVLPFFHSFGFTGTMWFPLVSGIGAVYHANPLDAKTIGTLIHKHQATILMATPTFLNTYTRRCSEEQFKSLRLVVVGAEKLKEPIADAFRDKFGIEPMEGYGCTELSPIVSLNLPDYTEEGLVQKTQKKGKIGLPLPGIAVKILNPETAEPVDVNQNGLMLIKGPNVMKGYLNKDQLTSQVINDGWYSTGDIANIDEDGFLMITDRLSRFSKIGGEMVPHIKVEEMIHQILKAQEQVCVVTCVPDEKKGEQLVVLYMGDLNPDELVSSLKNSELPNLWIPDPKMFLKIDTIPLLGTGKIDLSSVKKMALSYFI